MEKRIEIVGEQVLYQNGSFRRVRRWIRGWHPELGQLMMGFTGPETVMEVDSIRPMGTYYVQEANLPSPDIQQPGDTTEVIQLPSCPTSCNLQPDAPTECFQQRIPA